MSPELAVFLAMFYNVRRSQAVLKVHGIVLCAIMRAREVLSLGLYMCLFIVS